MFERERNKRNIKQNRKILRGRSIIQRNIDSINNIILYIYIYIIRTNLN